MAKRFRIKHFLSTCRAGMKARRRDPRVCLYSCESECKKIKTSPRSLRNCINQCHGYYAELSSEGAFTAKKYETVMQRRKIDLCATSSSTGKEYCYEIKTLDIPRYLSSSCSLNLSKIRGVLSKWAKQIKRYQNQKKVQRIRLIVRVPPTTTRLLASQLQRFLLQYFTPKGIRLTVIMPGSGAARAFDF